MACRDTTILIDAAGNGGRRLRSRTREKLAALVDAGEGLTTTRFNVAESWVSVERAEDRQAQIEGVERMLRAADRAGLRRDIPLACSDG
jgi:hypothetical protein